MFIIAGVLREQGGSWVSPRCDRLIINPSPPPYVPGPPAESRVHSRTLPQLSAGCRRSYQSRQETGEECRATPACAAPATRAMPPDSTRDAETRRIELSLD